VTLPEADQPVEQEQGAAGTAHKAGPAGLAEFGSGRNIEQKRLDGGRPAPQRSRSRAPAPPPRLVAKHDLRWLGCSPAHGSRDRGVDHYIHALAVSGETVLARSWNSRPCSIQAPAPLAASSSASFLARSASSTAYSASTIAE